MYQQAIHWKRAMKSISSYSLFQTQLFVGVTIRHYSLFLSHSFFQQMSTFCGKKIVIALTKLSRSVNSGALLSLYFVSLIAAYLAFSSKNKHVFCAQQLQLRASCYVSIRRQTPFFWKLSRFVLKGHGYNGVCGSVLHSISNINIPPQVFPSFPRFSAATGLQECNEHSCKDFQETNGDGSDCRPLALSVALLYSDGVFPVCFLVKFLHCCFLHFNCFIH